MVQRLQEEKHQWEAECAAFRRRLDEEERQWHAEHVALQRFTLGISPREWQVLVLLAEGRTYEQVAERLSIDIETVRTHVRHLAVKPDTSGGGRKAIITAAQEHGLLL